MAAAHLSGPSVGGASGVAPYYCQGKQRFASAVLAAEVAARSRREKRNHYRCHHCGDWHVGTASGGVLNAKQSRKLVVIEHATRPR